MKQSVHALSLTPHVNNWLANSGHPRILHIFDHACNLINERSQILSIVKPQIGNGPFNLVLEEEICFLDYFNLESHISIFPNGLTVGNLSIHTAEAKLWNPRPNWEVLHTRKGDIGNQLSQLPITNYLSIVSFDPLIGERSGLLNHSRLPISQSLVSNLSLALVNADISSARKLASQLAGLGVGLTPSGDDIIMGAIYAAWIIHPFDVVRVIAQEIANAAAPLTTSISAAWLKAAGRGEAGSLWHEFFDALVSSNHAQIEESMDNILAVGETSGTDALAGFIGVFESWMVTSGSSHG